MFDDIFKYTTDLQLNKNNNLHTIALYIDFKKAFDTVNHKLLTEKLKDMRIVNKVLKWIKSYLTNRNQCTRIGSITSSNRDVFTDIPQGSILGPLFFLCYINDITQICNNTNILLYADDTVLYKAISDDERFLDMHNFQQDVNRLVVWCQYSRKLDRGLGYCGRYQALIFSHRLKWELSIRENCGKFPK